MKPLLVTLPLLLSLWGTEARAGRNVFTAAFPHPGSWQGYRVTCAGRLGRCGHGAPPLVVTRDGLRFRTTARVVRRRIGYGVEVRVEVSVADGKRHGLLQQLTLSGRMAPLSRRNLAAYAFRGFYMRSSRMPQLPPGARVVLRDGYPTVGVKSPTYVGVRRGYRLRMRVALSGVARYRPIRISSPQVAVVVLTVPRRGALLIRLESPAVAVSRP